MRVYRLKPVLLLISLLFLASCGSEAPKPLDAYFVREGLALENAMGREWALSQADREIMRATQDALPDGVTALPGGRLLLKLPWQPGAEYTLTTTDQSLPIQAPLNPSPLLVNAIKLEDLKPHGGRMGHAPDTEVRFSPDGKRLAIGTINGRLLLAEIPSGKELWSRKLAEGMVKRLAWGSLKGKPVLLVGEQSPQGLLYCLDAADGSELWRFDPSQWLGLGSVSADKKHAVYNLPGIYYLRVMPQGDVLAVGTHGRFVGELYRHDCLIWRLDGASGRVKWRWPAQGNFPYGITWVGSAKDGNTLALISFTTFGPKEESPHLEGALYCLDGSSGQERWHHQIPPLKPHYSRVGTWQGISVSPDGKHVLAGLNDGRAMLFDAEDGARGPLWTLPVGAPVMVGDIPVAAPVSYARLGNGQAYLATPGTTIPSGVKAGRRTPQPHPRARHFFAYDLQGKLIWQHHTQGSAQGIAISDDGRWVATCVGASIASDDRNKFGLTLFDTRRGNGGSPLVYHYATEGPAFFQLDISPQGRYLALCESPYTRDEGKTVHGSYRVLVIH